MGHFRRFPYRHFDTGNIVYERIMEFFPVRTETDAKDIPDEGTGWGWFKVPGVWPGMGWGAEQPGDNNLIVLSPMAAAGFDPAGLNTAWYRRTVAIPAEWSGKRISLEITMLQTCARIFIDGKKSGELYYPGGKIDLTERIRPGKTQEIVLLVSAKNDELTGSVFMAPGRLVKSDAGVSNRGITGDMFLTAEPSEAAVSDVHVITSWRKNGSPAMSALHPPFPAIIIWKLKSKKEKRHS